MDPLQFRDVVIAPTLRRIGFYSPAAVNLVLATGLHESEGLRWLQRLGDNPGAAAGVFQMEPATHDDIWHNFLAHQDALAARIAALRISVWPDTVDQLAGNLYYATAMCRIHYRRVKAPLPAFDDFDGIAHYWKLHYNSERGAGTVKQFLKSVTAVLTGIEAPAAN